MRNITFCAALRALSRPSKIGIYQCHHNHHPRRSAHLATAAATSQQGAEPPSPGGPQTRGEIEEDPYDVVIVGGGMVGAAVGCGLASSPLARSLRVAIIDGRAGTATTATRTEQSSTNSSTKGDGVPDSRVSAITPATVRFLKSVDAWERLLERKRPKAFDSMQVWDYSGRGFTRYEAADVGKDVLGYVVENDLLISALTSTLEDQRSERVELIRPAKVKGVRFASSVPSAAKGLPGDKNSDAKGRGYTRSGDESLAQVLLEDGGVLHTRLVVGADGGRSRVREMAGIDTTGWDYHQHALICTVRVGSPHSTAWQRFLPTGPLALLPMEDQYSNIVWSTTPERAEELKAMSEEDFVLAVNRALVEDYGALPSSRPLPSLGKALLANLGNIGGFVAPSTVDPFQAPPPVTACVTSRLSFPLSLKHAKRYVSSRVALVGDAAHTVHPLAGQGVNLGFGDAASLVKILDEGIRTGADVGGLGLLELYEKDRMWANVPMMAVLDGFQRVFAADFLPVNLARAVGFNAANYITPLKKRIISYAMGV